MKQGNSPQAGAALSKQEDQKLRQKLRQYQKKQQGPLLTQLFFARDLSCVQADAQALKNLVQAGSEGGASSMGCGQSMSLGAAQSSKLKQRRERKALKQSVICSECSAEYHIACLISAYKNFARGQAKC